MRRAVVACLTLILLELLMVRSVNAAAMAIADSSEGCVLHVYKDPRGIATGGWGHSGPDLPPLGTPITQAQADAWRAADMARAAAFVEAHVTVPLTDNQFSVLAEWTYNVGVGNFLGSILLRVLNQGNYAAVPAQLMRWTKAGGKTLPGLVTRRLKEAALFTTPDHHEPLPSAASTVATASADPAPIATPSPPSLLERIRAWFFGNVQVPT